MYVYTREEVRAAGGTIRDVETMTEHCHISSGHKIWLNLVKNVM
jgi:hypothetical protein